MSDQSEPSAPIRRLCVFCGSRDGGDPAYRALATAVGRRTAEEGWRLVYGGGRVGLMGAAADGALAAGGTVDGVIPRALADREVAHHGLTSLDVVETMHERKARMDALSDAFVALPGGAGTLEEIFEQWTWAQLGIHAKPCAFLSVKGFYRPLREMVDRMVADGFVPPWSAANVIFVDDVDALFAALKTFRPTPADRPAPSDVRP